MNIEQLVAAVTAQVLATLQQQEAPAPVANPTVQGVPSSVPGRVSNGPGTIQRPTSPVLAAAFDYIMALAQRSMDDPEQPNRFRGMVQVWKIKADLLDFAVENNTRPWDIITALVDQGFLIFTNDYKKTVQVPALGGRVGKPTPKRESESTTALRALLAKHAATAPTAPAVKRGPGRPKGTTLRQHKVA